MMVEGMHGGSREGGGGGGDGYGSDDDNVCDDFVCLCVSHIELLFCYSCLLFLFSLCSCCLF